jgi:hypothetical protein
MLLRPRQLLISGITYSTRAIYYHLSKMGGAASPSARRSGPSQPHTNYRTLDFDKALSTRMVQKIVKKWADYSRLGDLSPHDLRTRKQLKARFKYVIHDLDKLRLRCSLSLKVDALHSLLG